MSATETAPWTAQRIGHALGSEDWALMLAHAVDSPENLEERRLVSPENVSQLGR
jgi:hypothetical protein